MRIQGDSAPYQPLFTQRRVSTNNRCHPVSSVNRKVDQLCDCVYAWIFTASIRMCTFFLLLLGGTDVLLIDLQDVKLELFECVTMEQCQTMLSVSEL